MIPYGRQDISEADIEAVVDVLRSDWLTQGPAIERFENEVADYCGARYAVAVCNATAALHIACLAAGLGRADTLWTSPNTFVASSNCALYCGAGVDFVDIDRDSYNMSVVALEEKLEHAARNNRLPKIVVPVHFSGQSCDMEAIAALSKRYGFTVLEDASHAIGGRYKTTRVGSCGFSDMTVFSFHPVKIVTTGEGGMVLTNRQDLYEKLLLLRSHGITRDPQKMNAPTHGQWYYQQVALGFNYRMTDMQAALGISQIKRLDEFVAKRHSLADRYDRLLAALPVTTPKRASNAHSAFHLYVIRLQRERIVKSHADVFGELRERGIGANLHYIPVHTQPYYAKMGFGPGDFPEAERYYAEAISLPMYAALSEAQQDVVVQALQGVLR